MPDRKETMSHKFMISRVSALLLGTAAGAFAMPAMAQSEPPSLTIPEFDAGNVDNAGTVVVSSDAVAGTFEVDVASQAAVMIYDSFDLGVDATASFTTSLMGDVTIVNRVKAGNPSDIYGTITSSSNVHLWLINPDGITFGSTGSFSGASLLLSTLPFAGSSADLLTELGTATPSVSFARTDTDVNTDGVGYVAIDSGATLNSNTGNMMLIGERLTVGGALTADDGSVVMVGAREVTFSDIGSPLSFSIVEGVRIRETDAGISVSGAVEGNSVVAAVGSRDGGMGPQSLMETVLSIEPGATLTATEVGDSIILATADTGSILVANEAGTAPSINVDGALSAGTSPDPITLHSITIQSASNVTGSGDIVTSGTVDVIAAGEIALGNVTGQGLTFTANNDLTFADLDANSQFINATSLTGNITGGDVTAGITASLDAAGGSIDVQNVLASQVLISALDTIQFASSNSTALAHQISSTAGDVIGGNVTSNQVVNVDVGAGRSITLGDVTAPGLTNLGSTVLSADSITLGTVVTSDALDLQTTNDIVYTSLTSTNGGVNLLSTAGAVNGGGIDANGNIDLNAGTDITTGSLAANNGGGVILTAVGNITAASITANEPGVINGFIDVESTGGGTLDLGAVASDGNIDLDTTGALTASSISSLGDLTIGGTSAPATVTFTGDVSADAIDIDATGVVTANNITATSGDVALDGSVINADTVSASRHIDINATNSITLNNILADTDADDDGHARVGFSTTPATANISGTMSGEFIYLRASDVNAGDVTATAGAATISGFFVDAGAVSATRGDVNIDAVSNITVGSVSSTTAGMTGGNTSIRSNVGGTIDVGLIAADDAVSLDTTGILLADTITAGGVLAVGGISAPSSATFDGNVLAESIDVDTLGAFKSLDLTSTNGDLDVNAASIDADLVSATGGDVTLQATGNITTSSITSTEALGLGGNIDIDSTAGAAALSDINATGAAFVDVGAGEGITLGNVIADSLSNGAATSLAAEFITFGTITTTNELYLIAANGDITGNTIRTDGTDIRLTASDEVLITGAFTALSGDPLVSGSIGIFAGDNVGSNSGGNSNGNPPQGNLDLQAGEDIAVLSSGGSIYLTDVLAGDDVFLDATAGGGGNGTVAFDRVELTNLNVDVRQTIFGGAAGQPLSVSFAPGEAANQLSRTLVVDARKSFLGDIVNVPGDLIITATEEATFNGNVDVLGDFIVTGTSVILGQSNQTRTQTATGQVIITATDGDISFVGDLTLQSNADGIGGEGLFLSARTTTLGNGDIGPAANGSINLIGGTALDPSPVFVTLDGNFAANVIDAASLSITDGINAFTVGDITIGSVTTDQALELRASGGSIDVDEAVVTDAGASLTFAVGGAGETLASSTSISTNGGDILLSAGGTVDVAQVSTNVADPLNPATGNVAIYGDADVLISNGVYAGEDVLVFAGNGDIGSSGTPVVIEAGDDIRLLASAGSVFVSSLTADGSGPDDSSLVFSNLGSPNATLLSLAEILFGSDIDITATNLFGPALSGSVEDGLIVRDLSVAATSLNAALGDIRIGDLSASAGNIQIEATAGSVTGLASGWTPLAGGSDISAASDVILGITGTAEVGSLTASVVSGNGMDNLTIRDLNVSFASLSAANRLHIDSGSAFIAVLATTGGSAAPFSLTNTPPVPTYGAANLTSQSSLTVNALSGAVQLGTISGSTLDVNAAAVDLQSATSTVGAVNATAGVGQLTIGTASSAAALTLDKTGASGALTANGALTSVDDLTVNSDTTIDAVSLVSSNGSIALGSTDDTSLGTAQSDNGGFASVISGIGDFTATSISAQSVAITDGVNAWAPGNITVDTLTSEQSLALRTNDGTITLNTVSTSNSGASITLAAGGAGQDLVSAGSITTNGGDMLLSAADMVDIVLASTSTAAPTAPTAATLAISAGGDVAISDAVYAGEDLVIDAGGNLGSTGNLITLDAGDDILVDVAGDVFLASAITDGSGIDLFNASVAGGPGRDASLLFAGETAPGAQVRIAATNLSGDPVTGSGEDALIVRDFTAGSALLTADVGDIRIGGLSPDTSADTGGLTATAGDIDITASAGSVSSLTDGWVVASGGPVISAPGDIVLDVTGTAAIGSITGAAVSNSSTQSLTIASLDASTVTLSAVDRLHIDSGTVTGAASLTTTGGTATTPSLTGSPPLPNYGWADLDSAGGVTVSAPVGAVQLNTVTADGAGGITINSGAAEILSAITAIGDISVTTNIGRLGLVDASTASDITLVKTGTDGTLALGIATSSGGDITATSSTSASITSATATIGNLAVTASGGDVELGTGTAGNDIALDASGDIDATTLVGGGGLTAIAGADVVIGSATMGGLIDVTAGEDIAVGTLDGFGVLLTATGDVSGLADGASTETLVPGFVRGDVTSGADIAVFAGGNVQLGTLDAATSTDISGFEVGVTDASAGTSIDIAATDGELTVGTADAGTTVTLGKAGTLADLTAGTLTAGGDITATSSTALDLASVTSTGGALTAVATNGDATIGTGSVVADITLTSSNDASATALAGSGDLLVTAGNDGTIATASIDGSITIDAAGTAGGGSLSGNGVALSGFAVNAATVDAGTGALKGTAAGGGLFIGTGTATGTITLTKTGDIVNVADGITSSALTSTEGDILLDSSTFVNVGSSNADGLLSIISPDTIVAASLTSDGSIALNTGGDAQLGDITAGVSLILLAAGDISADTLTVGEDIAALAGGGIAIGDFTAGDNVTMTAGTELDLGGGSTTGGGADNNTYILDLALAGTNDPNAIIDGPADAADGDILLESQDGLALTGTISVAAGDGTLTVRNVAGSAGTSASIGTGVGTSGGFEISETELGFLAADNVVVDAGDQDLALGNIAIASGTGTQSLRLLSTGDITLSGIISGAGTGTLQIGAGEIGANGFVDPATLSTSITATTETAGIDFANGIVDLRAVRIVFGLTDFVALTQGATLEQAALLVTDGASQLYIGDNSQKVFMQADTLRVAYSDFALFQNTAFSLGGGVILNADGTNSVNELALELFSQGDDNLDSFAIFGQVNGFTGRTAGVLPNAVLNIGTLSPRELRVTQARSRVNGCVIGSPDRGCLIVDLPPPEITTIDERQAQDLISTDDPSEFLNPLVGRGNEGLILDIAQVPVGIDTLGCDPDTETCEPTEPEQ